jgi:hypothetical protein
MRISGEDFQQLPVDVPGHKHDLAGTMATSADDHLSDDQHSDELVAVALHVVSE